MILGLDLATRTGFCWGAPTSLPAVGHHDLPRTGDDVGTYLLAFEAWISALVARLAPTDVVFEAPILGRMATAQVTRKLHALPGVVEMVCTRRGGINIGEAAPASVKKVLTGYGTAGKPEMIAAAEAYGLTITCSDEADAFGVWLATVRRRYPQFAERWAPLWAHQAATRPT